MVQQIARRRHPSRHTSAMRDVVAMLRLLVPLALVLGVLLSFLRNQSSIVRRVGRDDWRGVRDAASAMLARPSRWVPAVELDQARRLIGVAHFVLGDLPEARAALHQAAGAEVAGPLHAAAARQLASVERAMGDVRAARDRLRTLDVEEQSVDQSYLDVQLALLALADGDAVEALHASERAVSILARRRDAAHTTVMQHAYGADVVQTVCIQVRALLATGEVDRAVEQVRSLEPPDKRPYVLGQVHEARARVALATGDRATAGAHLEAAVGCFTTVGAQVELARMGVLRALVDRDVEILERAERELRALGALGYLQEVEDARRALAGEQ
jgi:tetratricopeptide (TPR) repeat protein